MYDNLPERSDTHDAGSAWSAIWGLLFVCTMTLVSMATARSSGYEEPRITVAHAAEAPLSAAGYDTPHNSCSSTSR